MVGMIKSYFSYDLLYEQLKSRDITSIVSLGARFVSVLSYVPIGDDHEIIVTSPWDDLTWPRPQPNSPTTLPYSPSPIHPSMEHS